MNALINARFQGQLGKFSLDVAFTAPARGVTALFGPSGCGKTTVLRCVAGLNRLAGRLQIGDALWQSETHCLPTHRRPIGYVFQEASLFAHLSVRQNLLFGHKRARKTVKTDTINFDEVVDLLGLARLLARSPAHLSGGERQRVAVGRALLSQPRLLLMDEPLSALDRISKDEILPYLERLHAALSIPVLYVSHDIDEVKRLANTVIRLRDGRVQSAGPIEPDASAAVTDDTTLLLGDIVGRDARYGLLQVRVGNVELQVPDTGSVIGARQRLRIRPGDVSLSRQSAAGSVLNVLPARLRASHVSQPYRVTATVELGHHGSGAQIRASIPRKAWDELGLSDGEPIYAQVHAAGLDGGALSLVA